MSFAPNHSCTRSRVSSVGLISSLTSSWLKCYAKSVMEKKPRAGKKKVYLPCHNEHDQDQRLASRVRFGNLNILPDGPREVSSERKHTFVQLTLQFSELTLLDTDLDVKNGIYWGATHLCPFPGRTMSLLDSIGSTRLNWTTKDTIDRDGDGQQDRSSKHAG
jgi:hypothetical protein